MKQLSSDWFVEGTLDFEYKKYLLLAYLQHVGQEFAGVRLYPSLSDLIGHYRNLLTFQEEKRKFYERFPQRLSEEEFRKLKLKRTPEVEDPEDMQEIESIISYALPNIKQHLKDGKEIYEYIEEKLTLEPIGILPLYKQEGYLLLRIQPHKDIKVFQYHIVFFENTEANYHGISFRYLDTYTHSLVNTYEAIKLALVRRHATLPNPATYLLYAGEPFPEEESLLPVAKRKMLAHLKTAS